jgi:hypothetical protein
MKKIIINCTFYTPFIAIILYISLSKVKGLEWAYVIRNIIILWL